MNPQKMKLSSLRKLAVLIMKKTPTPFGTKIAEQIRSIEEDLRRERIRYNFFQGENENEDLLYIRIEMCKLTLKLYRIYRRLDRYYDKKNSILKKFEKIILSISKALSE
ncbi:hypothetical protein COU57_03550 [Candidatus Pacearchaeota archaeon CG10_big_fil_rev_8_21_14_0_10_32_14]|nr:MAG: hypothetical protein COU57_03550 [Candidatus Pacearchaeota archaeon CG10_big_fil_rev_8_21_14_0_10_32_14]